MFHSLLRPLLLMLCLGAPVFAQEGEGLAQVPPPPVDTDATPLLDPPVLEPPPPRTTLNRSGSDNFRAMQDLYGADAPATAEASVEEASEEEQADPLWVDALRLLVYTAGICGTIVLLLFLLRRVGERTRILAGPELGEVLGRIHLGPKSALHLVRTGGRVLVIGVSGQNMRLLAEMDAAAYASEPAPSTATPPAAAGAEPKDFAAELRRRQATARLPASEQEDLSELRGDLERLQRYLSDRNTDV